MVSSIQGARFFYWALHILVNFYFFYYKTDLRVQFQELRLFWPVVYLASTVIGTYLVYTVGRRPGYLKFAKEQEVEV
jgi:hypothetical protein